MAHPPLLDRSASKWEGEAIRIFLGIFLPELKDEFELSSRMFNYIRIFIPFDELLLDESVFDFTRNFLDQGKYFLTWNSILMRARSYLYIMFRDIENSTNLTKMLKVKNWIYNG